MGKFILSKSKVLEQYKNVKNHSDIISYSTKTNQDVTKILEQNTDCLFSVHFFNELKHIEDTSRVIFLAQAWTSKDIKKLVELNITHFIVDNESDLNTMLEFLEGNQAKVHLFLRLKLMENTIKTEKYFVFGMKSEVINRRIKEITNNETIKDKILSLGVHFHRKTQNMSEWNLKYELSNILEEDTLKNINNLCIGGGLPSEYANTNMDVLPSIFKRVDELKEWLSEHNIKLIIEPGRFIAAPAVKLATKILGIHDETIIVDVSVYNCDMDAVIVPVKLLIEGEGQGKPYAIKGITPCSMDLFRYKAYLNEPKVGDELIFLNAGAYTFTSDFCDLEKLETEVIE